MAVDIPRASLSDLSPLSLDKEMELTSPAFDPSPEPIEEESPLRIFVFDTQRTSAQLFNRQLLSHLRFGSISNPYALAATLGPERIQPKLENNEQAKQAWDEQVATAPPSISSLTYERATVKFLTEADRLESQGKILFVREHSPLLIKHDIILSSMHSRETIVSKTMNPTVMPDDLLKCITPIIFIRHPAKVIPAWLREANSSTGNLYTVDDDDLTLWTSARWSRIIFDYLRGSGHYKRPGSQRPVSKADSVLSSNSVHSMDWSLPIVASRPIVIDAADAVHNTHAILATLCRLLELDVQGVQDTWSPGTKLSRAAEIVGRFVSMNFFKAFSDRLTHPERDTSEYNINLDVEQKLWSKEFGAETAVAIRRKVEDEMPHYNYLKSFKLHVRPSVSEITFKENVFGVPLAPRSTIDGPMNSIWMEGEKSNQSALTEICRSASLGQVPVGIMS